MIVAIISSLILEIIIVCLIYYKSKKENNTLILKNNHVKITNDLLEKRINNLKIEISNLKQVFEYQSEVNGKLESKLSKFNRIRDKKTGKYIKK